tara:strand:+ start:391 stop:684 length:294 start_codon:yes stop_codon:yes gene_type:complete
MAFQVNPPQQLKIPRSLIGDREAMAFFDQMRTILTQLYDRTGGAIDAVGSTDSQEFNRYNSMIQQIQKELDGLPEFTIDTTGFTFDSTKITFDKVIA